MKQINLNYSPWEKTVHFFGMIWFILKEIGKPFTKRWFWLVISFILYSYMIAWFNSNYEIKASFKWGVYERAPKTLERKEGAKEEQISTPSASLVKTVVAKEVKPTTVFPHKKFLTDKGAETRQIVMNIVQQMYSGDDLIAFDNLIKKESGYRFDALNEIGAGGLCQAYPATKMNCPLTEDGISCQVTWCAEYINRRYGSAVKAWEFHLQNNWF